VSYAQEAHVEAHIHALARGERPQMLRQHRARQEVQHRAHREPQQEDPRDIRLHHQRKAHELQQVHQCIAGAAHAWPHAVERVTQRVLARQRQKGERPTHLALPFAEGEVLRAELGLHPIHRALHEIAEHMHDEAVGAEQQHRCEAERRPECEHHHRHP
jgi:hypothetical protein